MNLAQATDIAAADENVVTALFRLLSVVMPHLPVAVLRSKLDDAATIFEKCLTQRHAVQPAVRAVKAAVQLGLGRSVVGRSPRARTDVAQAPVVQRGQPPPSQALDGLTVVLGAQDAAVWKNTRTRAYLSLLLASLLDPRPKVRALGRGPLSATPAGPTEHPIRCEE